MSRKPKKGYFVRGQFVAEGSELDLELKRELKGTDESSKTDLKRESTDLQNLGEDMLTLNEARLLKLGLSEKLSDAVLSGKRMTNFEGKRRQMQYIGKMMRKLEEPALASIRLALEEQRHGPIAETMALHEAERWRDRLLANDDALGGWIETHLAADAQQLRALVRQARKDMLAASSVAKPGQPTSPGAAPGAAEQSAQAAAPAQASEAPRPSKAFRELFQLVRAQLIVHADLDRAAVAVEEMRQQDA